ncbi:hypothetical protein RHMOL_Rhmol01G0349600 [Rhododendron molle]|uniref:Uncharacterized protein n=1 Tax=Rhododendron molle TaxID=49168 RepID=A0ACC0Q9I4_RHOML|nr:hypothetical protein RHMOL_Rhmol01G0349600 [Rhododendron molle]
MKQGWLLNPLDLVLGWRSPVYLCFGILYLVFNNPTWHVENIGELIKTKVAMWIKVKFDIKVHSVEDFKGYLNGTRKVMV